MSTIACTSHHIKKHPFCRDNVKKVSRSTRLDKATACGNQPSQEKLSLLQDVDKLKKKLRDEENIHRALQRAFNRPLGALPRLPPYLPLDTQELLAEIAVLEEEVTRLEEQVVNYRQNLYQEAVFICSKKKLDNPMEYFERITSLPSREEQSDTDKSPSSVVRTVSLSSDIVSTTSVARTGSTSSCQSSLSLGRTASTSSDIVYDQREQSFGDPMNGKQAINELHSSGDSLEYCKGQEIETPSTSNHGAQVSEPSSFENSSESKGKENQTRSLPNIQLSDRKLSRVKTPVRKSSFKRQPSLKSVNSPRKQPVNKASGGDSEPNKVSEDILKCLCSIFIRLSSTDDKRIQTCYSSSFESNQDMELQDPYGTGAEYKERDIGIYKHLSIVDAISIDLKRKRNALFLVHKLKLLLGKLARVNLDGLSHQHKLAFWINTYNSCMMNAFLEHGIPESPEKVVLLMREATITVGGQKLTAITIEHFILRLPFYVKQGGKRTAKGDDLKASNMFGLECTEPLVTFALSCGSWSSPAVKVYTASQIESELETTKKEYLQAAVGISKDDNLIIPKLLDWYQLDFAKDFQSLLNWVCLQLPDELRKEALNCLETKINVPVSESVEVIPYDFAFRYLIHS